jgi:ketosteroid isomerase-like protein
MVMAAKIVLWITGVSAAAFGCLELVSWTQMTLRTWFLATVGAILLSTAVGARPGDVANTGARSINAEIVKTSDGYRTAVLAGDARAAAATYTEDGAELPPGHSLMRGRAAIEQHLRGLFAGAKVSAFTFSHLETAIDGNMAYDAGTYQQSLSLPSGQVMSDVGKYVAVLKRTPEGWKAAYVIYNSDGTSPSPCSSR